MNNASDVTKKMIRVIAISALVFTVIGVAVCIYRSLSPFPYILGVVLGAALTAYKLIMLERAIEKAMLMDAKTSGNYIRLQYMLRLLLTGILLVLGALTPFISLWGAAAGILTLQVALFSIKRDLDAENKRDASKLDAIKPLEDDDKVDDENNQDENNQDENNPESIQNSNQEEKA